ncbi:hypothetical protein PBY51_001365 [Eleginops maclovinus]|uniref:Uncharacterized protein n=1 Tax=Eleginops maclovinus TaxID=56733 RepID=A0AAN7WWA8_ELEMC|nr:hypothetical protein PBY51_001365 [Eleginops maclovinus]
MDRRFLGMKIALHILDRRGARHRPAAAPSTVTADKHFTFLQHNYLLFQFLLSLSPHFVLFYFWEGNSVSGPMSTLRRECVSARDPDLAVDTPKSHKPGGKLPWKKR